MLCFPSVTYWKEALSRISARAGCSARTEPSYASVGVAAVGRQGAQADIEVTLPPLHSPTLQLMDIFMIHPCCPTYVAAASQTRVAAAALRDRSKHQAHAGHLHPGHTFVPASVETYGHLGKPIMRYLDGSYPERYRIGPLSGCHPGVVSC
jgi:hypothetical protein